VKIDFLGRGYKLKILTTQFFAITNFTPQTTSASSGKQGYDDDALILSVCKKVFRAETENYNSSSSNINILDLVNQSLINGLLESASSDDSLVFKLEGDEDSSPVLPNAQANTDGEETKKESTSSSRMFRYLMESYNRVAYEERTQPKVILKILIIHSNILICSLVFSQKFSSQPMSSFLVELRAQIVQHAALVLTGQFDVDENLISPHSPLLLEHILAQNLPRGFLNELVFRLHTVDCETLSEVCLKIFLFSVNV
jgi:hypothetical protein